MLLEQIQVYRSEEAAAEAEPLDLGLEVEFHWVKEVHEDCLEPIHVDRSRLELVEEWQDAYEQSYLLHLETDQLDACRVLVAIAVLP